MNAKSEIPLKPKCFTDRGVLRCDCGGTPQQSDCIAARYFWLHVDQIITRQAPEERNGYIAAVAKSENEKRLLRRAARTELASHRSMQMEIAA
jgi:hypothetical protein